jgi:phosphate transport system permease protein
MKPPQSEDSGEAVPSSGRPLSPAETLAVSHRKTAGGKDQPRPTQAAGTARADGGHEPVDLHRRGAGVDAVFAGAMRSSAVFILLLMAAIAVFLIVKAWGAISQDKVNFISSTAQWDVSDTPVVFGLLPVAWGTLLTSLIGLIIATPIAVGVALFITQYAPRRLAQLLGYLVDLLAAVGGVVYGLWGLIFLVPHITGISQFLNTVLGWIPLFASDGIYGRSIFTAGVVLAIMILPIIAAISREVFARTPRENMEAAYALGATRWEMIRHSVLPYGRSGVSSAIVLGFGRALGETIAVALVLSANFKVVFHILESGGNTIAANIATLFGDAIGAGQGALIASGLLLFIVTLIVNYIARLIVRRSDAERSRRPATSVAELAPGLSAETSPLPARERAGGEPRQRVVPAGRPAGVLDQVGFARRLRNLLAGALATLAFLLALAPLIAVLSMVVSRGAPGVNDVFLTHSMRNVIEQDPGGGAYHAILGTLEQVGLATAIAVPIGVSVAVYLVEYGRGRLRTAVTFFVDVMTGLPSIVAGLFILALWILALGLGATGFAGSLALLILMLPMVIRGTEEMLKLVPLGLREASYALGVPRWRTVVSVVLPSALPGIITSVMLAVARVMGETAPILLVVSTNESINPNPFSGPQGSLPLFVYDEASQPYTSSVDRAWAGALVLIVIVMVLNLIARLLAWWRAPGRDR